MIDVRIVTDTIVAALDDALDAGVRFATAPAGDPDLYVVVEIPPGSLTDGSLGDPEQGLDLRVRLRCVVRHTDATQAARACLDLATQARTAILDRTTPIAATGWACTGRQLVADAGLDLIGPIANHIADYELKIAKA